jgi:thiamine-phosphate pyrophosphorylase
MPFQLPRLYAIIDPQHLPADQNIFDYAKELIAAGVSLIQLRDKHSSSRQILSDARELARVARGSGKNVKLIMNDRADLAVSAGFDGVHLGQEDISAEAARLVCPSPLIMIGLSTHTLNQVAAADSTTADYLAFGPVFSTSSKQDPDPVVGVEGLKAARKLTRKPLVAIGGITPANCRQVIEAGADSVAVITALTASPRKSVEAFLSVLG